MKSVFNPSDNEELIARINLLTPTSQPVWGKMNVAQMMGHCQRAIEVGTGLLELKRTALGFVFGRMALRQLMTKPTKRNLPTDKNFIVPNTLEFEAEKAKLIALYSSLSENGSGLLKVKKHPFFGEMTDDQWDVLLWKHLDHHLQQFGV